jgi:hypothetical protein
MLQHCLDALQSETFKTSASCVSPAGMVAWFSAALMRWALSQAWVNFLLAGAVQHCLDALHSETPMTSVFCVSLAGVVQRCLDALGFESGLGELLLGRHGATLP